MKLRWTFLLTIIGACCAMQNIEDIRKVDLVITKGKYIFPNEINESIGVKAFVSKPSSIKKRPHPGLHTFLN
ncbi:MAG: hypothetical protein WCJ99_10505 [Betaproteobacteria bacterium]